MTELDQTDIAIVGMAGLFPKAPNVATYWANILNKVDAIDEPLPEWGADLYYDPASTEATRLYTKRGGFLRELSRFNPQTFGIMPVSTAGSEPDQFHALELARAALLDAGLRENEYEPESIGVILGHGTHPNRANMTGAQHAIFIDQHLELMRTLWPTLAPEQLQRLRDWLKRQLPPFDVDNIPGLVPNMMTGRIANRLNFMGPNCVVDAACASSLIAVEAAMLELRRGRADIMLTGGINTSTSPLVFMIFCMLGALSPTARIRPFAADANGTMLGEGGGVLVLKRLADARRDGNRIYAILKAVGQSSDGKAKGLTAPRLEGELLAMRRAYQQAGLAPQSFGLIEAHGTGIPLGDQTETQALLQLLGERQRTLPHIALGSVKSMIGHCIPGAGIAGLIKTALALHHKILPPTLCDEVNPELGLERTPLYVNTETRPWIHGGRHPRRAAVNAFGFGGVNSHALLEEDPDSCEEPLAAFLPPSLRQGGDLLTFAAPDRDGLRAQLRQTTQRLREQPDLTLATVAGELWRQCGAGAARLAVVAEQREDALRKLEQADQKLAEPARSRWQTRGGVYFCAEPLVGKLAFLFPGENSQYPNMLKALALEFPVVRRWFDFLDGLFREDRDIAPGEAIFPPPTGLNAEQQAQVEERLSGMELGSESVFVAGRAIDALLRQLGVQPELLLGHSTGENGALMASGLFQLDEAGLSDLVRRMNENYQTLEAAGELPPGVLLSVGGVPLEQVRALLDAGDPVYVTMDNCEHQFILFGSEAAITAAHEKLRQEGALCVRLPMGRGYHTPLMEPMARAFRSVFEDVAIGVPNGQAYSCVEAAPFPTEATAARDWAASQYRLPVRFRESVQRLHADGARLFVEVGPSGYLTGFVRDILRGQPHVAVASDDRRREDLTPLRHVLATLFVQGVALDLNPLYGRAEAPPGKSAPYLSTAIPVIHVQEAEAQRLREWLTVASAAETSITNVTAPAVASLPRLANATTPTTTPPPLLEKEGKMTMVNRRQAALNSHLQLMQEFLGQQERIMTAWLSHRRQR